MHRVAVMRSVVDDAPESIQGNSREFWPTVDTTMATLLGVESETAKSEQDILSDFHFVYELDIETYGMPKIKPTNITDGRYQWKLYVNNVNKLASRAIFSTDTGGKKGSAKRKRTPTDVGARRHQSIGDDNEPQTEDEDDQVITEGDSGPRDENSAAVS
ncbi:hypothetical protein GGU11DRAFT_130281 [Lentinula aff. detonsa]|nr:hypothetical protein GGU11DRAFT_130281 [Lentinula aff. detonsa]